MTLEPLIDAPLAIQIHVAAVLPAALIGAFLLLWPGKGTPVHRQLGKFWLVLMAITALSSFFIHELRVIGDFSPIHLLSIATLAGCVEAYRSARRGAIKRHRRIVQGLYAGAILIAGAFTFMPSRIMNRVIFDERSLAQSLLVIVPLLLIGLYCLWGAWPKRLPPWQRGTGGNDPQEVSGRRAG